MDNFFSSPDLFDDVHTTAIYCCETTRQNHKVIQEDFTNKTLKLKWGDIQPGKEVS